MADIEQSSDEERFAPVQNTLAGNLFVGAAFEAIRVAPMAETLGTVAGNAVTRQTVSAEDVLQAIEQIRQLKHLDARFGVILNALRQLPTIPANSM